MSCWKRCELILNGWDLDTPTGFFVSKRMIFRSEHCAFETFQYTSVQSLREKRLTLHIETYETCPKSWKGTQSIETRHSKGSRNYTQKYSHPNTNCKNTSNTTYNQQTFCCFKGIPRYNLLWVGHSLQQRLQTLKALPPEQLKQIIDELGAQRIPRKNEGCPTHWDGRKLLF